jgi:hypothetical protein
VAGGNSPWHPEIRKLRLKIPVIFIAKSEEEIYVPESYSPFGSEEGRKGISLHPGDKDKDKDHRFAIPKTICSDRRRS